MKYDPHSNHKNSVIPGVRALREEAVDVSAIPSIVGHMLVAGPVSGRRLKLVYSLATAAVAAMLGAAVLAPRTARAASVKDVVNAASQWSSWYEATYRPDRSGKLQLVNENWNAPGKTALTSPDGYESRFNGHVQYIYWPQSKTQRITPWGCDGFPLSTIEGFEAYKLVDVKPEGKLLRYRFAIHQDILVDPESKLPVERDVFNPDGSILEIHKIYLTSHIDPRVFEADVKPDVTLYNIPVEQAEVGAQLAVAPQTRIVGGLPVSLRAVIVDGSNSIGAVIVGGARHPKGAHEHMQVVGLAAPEARNVFDYEWAPSPKKALIVGGRPAHVERAGWLQRPTIPDRFMLRVPVWGANSNLLGWAEFNVDRPVRTESIDEVLPNFVPPEAAGTGSTVSAGR